MVIEITRKIEFDAGHRIPDHKSKCRNMHGHRYVLEATVRGAVSLVKGVSDQGMIQDFGDLKALMMAAVGDQWDHAFLCHDEDPHAEAIGKLGRTVFFRDVPTVENLVAAAASEMRRELYLGNPSGLLLHRVRLYETPNCWADWYAETTA